MTADIRKLVHATPFVPFTIHLADGGKLRVPTVDHIAMAPVGGRIIVFNDDGTHEILSALLISRVKVGRTRHTSQR
jgi:hypothetical protein